MLRSNRLLWMTVPALLLYLIFTIYPLMDAVRLSFTDFAGVGKANYVGLENYRTVFSDSKYLSILVNTVLYAIVVVVVQTTLGLLIAALLQPMPIIRNIARVGMLAPAMMSLVAAGFIWQYIYSPLGGGLNEALKILALGDFQQIWLGNKSIALYSVAAVQIWMFVGYTAAVFLAGYAGISNEIREAATLDGSRGWTRFWHIDVPLLAPAFTINLTLSMVGTLKSFELPLVLTDGGPDGATTTLGLGIFKEIFGRYQFGLACALSMVMLVGVATITLVQNRILRAREDRI